MKAFITIKLTKTQDRNHIEKITSIFKENGFETICSIHDIEEWGQVKFSPKNLMERIFKEIDSSDIIVIDITEEGVDLGVEAGYAYAKKIPIIRHGSN